MYPLMQCGRHNKSKMGDGL